MSQKKAKPSKSVPMPAAPVAVDVPSGYYLVPAGLLQRMHDYIMQCPSGNQPAGAAVEIAFALKGLTDEQNAKRQPSAPPPQEASAA